MKRFLVVAGAMISLLLTCSAASAQASRTWVSGVGDDVNPCSRTAPCKTFAGAISKTAVNGEINCLDNGGFGAVTITKSISLDCREQIGSILYSGTNGVNIAFDSFAATDIRKTVNLRGLMFQGFDSGIVGIRIFGAGTGSLVNVEDCLLNGNFASTAAGIADQRTSGGTLTVVKTTIRNMGAVGLTTAGTAKTTLSDVRIINATTGVLVAGSAVVQVTHSVIQSNATSGLTTQASGTLFINNSQISSNGTGITQSGGTVVISNNDFSFNGAGFTGSVSTYTNNRFVNNNSVGTFVPVGTTSNPTGNF
jgi:hypothetical protein